MKTLEALRAIEATSVDQYGLITSAQAQRIGIDRTTLSRLVNSGDLSPIRRGVYGKASSSIDQLRELRAAWLSTSPELFAFERVKSLATPVVALESATTVHEIGDLIPDKHSFITATRKQSRHYDLRFVRKVLAKKDVTVVNGLPVTTVECTVKDLAEQRLDGEHLADVINAALQRSLLTPEQLLEALSGSAQRYGYADSQQFAKSIGAVEGSKTYPLTRLSEPTRNSLKQTMQAIGSLINTEAFQTALASTSQDAALSFTPDQIADLGSHLEHLNRVLASTGLDSQLSQAFANRFSAIPAMPTRNERSVLWIRYLP